MPAATIGGIWIAITDALYTTYNTTQNANILHDDGAQEWLRLRVPPNGFQRTRLFLSEVGTDRAEAATLRRKPAQKQAWELATPESREAVLKILEALIDEPVTVQDHSNPLSIVTRTMYVNDVVAEGSISDGSNAYYPNGFVVTLEEA